MGKLAVTALVVGILLAFGMGIGGAFWGYYQYQYPIDKANAYVDLAAASNDLNQVLADLNQTMTLLAPYHGNPNILFPTGHTNFDLIKEQIASTILSGLVVVKESPDNYSYQQALKNIQSDLTTTIEGELNDAGGAEWAWNFGWTEWFVWPVSIFMWLTACVTWRD